MLNTFNKWLEDNVQSDGILGAGVRYHDKTVHAIVVDRSFKKENVEFACVTAAEVFQAFKLRKSAVPRLDWKFEGGVLYTAMRPDGNCLCFITKPGAMRPDELDRIFYEFQTLWG